MSPYSPLKATVFALTVSWICVVTVTGAIGFDFDCRRKGVNCGDGICDISNGQCDCSKVTVFTPNYRCQNKADFPCSETTYGGNCALDRVQVDCTGDEMFININPDGNFSGIIYVSGKENTDECRLKESATKPDYVKNKEALEGWSLALGYTNEACGNAQTTLDETNGTKTTTNARGYFIQYNSNFKSGLDQKVSVKCVLTEGSTKVAGKVEDINEELGIFKDVNVDSDVDNDVITFNIVNKNDKSITGEVNLGDEIKLVFTLTPDRGYVDFSLESCSANNTVEDEGSNDFRSITFVNDNCPSTDGQALFQDGIVKSADANNITVSISAFMFSGTSSKVGFSCDIKLCREANKDDCKKGSCDGITSDADKEAEAALESTITAPPGNSSDITSDNSTASANNTDSVNPDTGNVANTTVSSANNTGNTTTPSGDDVNIGNGTTGETPPNANTTTADAGGAGNAGGLDDAGGENVTTTAAPTGGEEAPARRRRRAAGDGGGDTPVKTVYSDMTVRDPTAVVEEPRQLTEEVDCMKEPEIITVIAILSVMVVTLSLVTLVVICHFIGCGPRKKVMDEDYGSSSSSSSSNSFSGNEMRTRVEPSVRGFNIPRLEIRTQHTSHNHYTTT